MNLTKKEDEDFVTYAGIVNKECEKFELNELISDMFKGLIFVQGLTAKGDAEIRARILTKLEQNQKLTLQEISDEFQIILNLRHKKLKKKNAHTYKQKKKMIP